MAAHKDSRGTTAVNVDRPSDNRRRWVYLLVVASILVVVLAVAANLLGRSKLPIVQSPVTASTPTSGATSLATLAAVVPTVPSGQTAVGTPVSIAKVGLSVQLPGPRWTSMTPDDYPDTQSDRWYNVDRSLVFAVFVFDDHMREGHVGLKGFAEEFAHDFQITPIGESRDVSFQGNRAWRIEGMGQGQQETFGPEYRFVEYWLEKENGVYLIVAGSKLDNWGKGGAAQVEAILGSVTLDS